MFDTSVSNTYHYTEYMEKVLVLNSDYTPLNVTTMRRGFVLVDKGKAEVLKKDKNPAEKVYKLIMNSAYGKTIEKAHNVMTRFVAKDKFKDFMVKKSGSVKEVFEMDNHFRIKHEVGIKGHFTLPHVGCSVLAMSKRIMNEVFEVVEDDVYYTDTDSMFVTQTGLNKLTIFRFEPLLFQRQFVQSRR